MMINSLKLVLCIFCFTSSFCIYASEVTEENICDVFKNEKEHVAYLLNQDGHIGKGPIDYGKWIDDGKSDNALIATKYKLLIFPARTQIENNDCFSYGCLKLTKSKPLCKGVSSYDISIRLVFRRKEQGFYQYSDDTELMELLIFDPKAGYDPPPLKYKFIPRLKGIVAGPK